MKKRLISLFICICMFISSLCVLSSCEIEDSDRERSRKKDETTVDPEKETGKESEREPRPVVEYKKNESFEEAQMYFALNLFKESVYQREDDSSIMISPTSVMAALAMTANGARGETLVDMEKVLGGLEIGELNASLSNYIDSLPSSADSKLNLANSVWMRDTESLQVKEEFLAKMLEYYSAELNREAFDDSTVNKINKWVEENTDGMIDKIVEQIDPLTMMYLINAVCFDAKWSEQYQDHQVRDGEFTDVSGEVKKVKMLYSDENRYIEYVDGAGFVKPYEDGYSFVALLPDEGVSVYDYISTMESEGLKYALDNPSYESVITAMPEFSFEYEVTMNDILISLGMDSAFVGQGADFTDMAICGGGKLAIGAVVHKTFIEVTQAGTRAAAVTSVEMNCESAPMPPEKEIILDRPFVYMIVDDETNLPIFIGAVTEVFE